MEDIAVKRYLTNFAKRVVSAAKKNVKKKSSSGKLEQSIKYSLTKDEEGIYSVKFLSAPHGKYIDKGVSGVGGVVRGKSYSGKQTYKNVHGVSGVVKGYSSKRPPMSALDKWIVKKVKGARDEKGRFIPRKSLQFLIARSIYRKGIEGIEFYTAPLRTNLMKFPSELLVAFKEDFTNSIMQIKPK